MFPVICQGPNAERLGGHAPAYHTNTCMGVHPPLLALPGAPLLFRVLVRAPPRSAHPPRQPPRSRSGCGHGHGRLGGQSGGGRKEESRPAATSARCALSHTPERPERLKGRARRTTHGAPPHPPHCPPAGGGKVAKNVTQAVTG